MPATGPHAHASDEALLARAAAGDQEAFAVLYRRHQRAIYRFACAMIGTRDSADDVVHDAFLALLDDARRFDPRRAALTTYLYGVVRNLCRTQLRRRARFDALDPATDRADTAAAPPLDALEEREEAATVRHALRRLPSRYREVVLLCDLHERSYAEAAAIVGTSVPAVRSRLHRGRRQLKLAIRAAVNTPADGLVPERYAV
jgi:RNA polymerase sigma-70 factor (ECF subfamily)